MHDVSQLCRLIHRLNGQDEHSPSSETKGYPGPDLPEICRKVVMMGDICCMYNIAMVGFNCQIGAKQRVYELIL